MDAALFNKPAPYPADTRAKGWRFELDTERIRQSDTWALAGPEIRPWLLLLWMTAWEQTPCGSLPADDRLIAARLDMPLNTFVGMRDTLMRGWWLAEDGRLYHGALVDRVTEMMAHRRKESDRKALARSRNSAASQQGHAVVASVSRGTDAGIHPESDTGTGTSSSSEPSGSVSPGATTAARSTTPCPHQDIVAAYHELLPTLPKCRLLEADRKRALNRMWGWVLSSKKSDGSSRATNAEQAMNWMRDYFLRASDNDFLMGRTPRSAEHANWKCDLDYLLTDKGKKQVIEKTMEPAA